MESGKEGRGMNSACSKLISASLRFNSFTPLREFLMKPWKSVCLCVCIHMFVFWRTFSVQEEGTCDQARTLRTRS